MAKADLSADRLRELLDYNPETGDFFHRSTSYCGANNRVRVRAGDRAGHKSQVTGYLVLRVDGRNYQAHRVAWLYVYGVWPRNEIDHIDGDRSNNRISNLRDVSRAVNAQNLRWNNLNTASKHRGVHFNKPTGRWYAKIKVGGKVFSLGGYANPEDAHAVYLEAKRRLHPGCTI